MVHRKKEIILPKNKINDFLRNGPHGDLPKDRNILCIQFLSQPLLDLQHTFLA